MSTTSTGARQTSGTRSTRGSKSDDNVFVSVTTEDEVQKIMQDYDERLKKMESIVDEKLLSSQAEFQEFGKRLWKLEQTTDDKSLTSQVATEVSKSLSVELKAVRAESRDSLLSSNDNEHTVQSHEQFAHSWTIRSLAVDFIKSVLHVSGIEETDIEVVYSAFPIAQQPSNTPGQARRPVILVRFARREHRDKVIRARRVLKGSKYAVSEDLTLLNVKTMSQEQSIRTECVVLEWKS